jgi:hypothetical protein
MTKRLPPLAIAILLFPSAALCGPKIKVRIVAPDQVTKFTKNKPVEVVLLDGDLRHGSVRAADALSLDLLSASGVLTTLPTKSIQEIRFRLKTPCGDTIASALASIISLLIGAGGAAAMNEAVIRWGGFVAFPIYFCVCAATKGKPYYSQVLRLDLGAREVP